MTFGSLFAGIGGMGRERWFLVPEGLVTVEDMVRYEGYGLLWVVGSSVRVKLAAVPRATNEANEILMLVSALRRVKTREFLTINVFTGDDDDAPAA